MFFLGIAKLFIGCRYIEPFKWEEVVRCSGHFSARFSILLLSIRVLFLQYKLNQKLLVFLMKKEWEVSEGLEDI